MSSSRGCGGFTAFDCKTAADRDQLLLKLRSKGQESTVVVPTVSKTYVRRPWFIVLVNLGYSFNVHARLPLRVAMSQHCEEPRCSFHTLEGRSLIGHCVALFNVLISRFS